MDLWKDVNDEAPKTESTRPGKRRHVCEYCDKSFTKTGNLNVHRKIHTGEKPFSCDLCDKSFIRKESMIVHRRTHTGDRPFVCDVCNKAFFKSSNLTVHKQIHLCAKPYKCDICHKSFSRSNHMTKHRNKHFISRPFTCEICSEGFDTEISLQVHQMMNHTAKTFDTVIKQDEQNDVDTQKRRFPCGVCGKSFTSKRSLISHTWRHTGIKPYSCDYCSMTFTDASTCRRHKKVTCKKRPIDQLVKFEIKQEVNFEEDDSEEKYVDGDIKEEPEFLPYSLLEVSVNVDAEEQNVLIKEEAVD